MSTIELEKSAADLLLHRGLFDPERRKSRWVDQEELPNAILNAWLLQHGDACPVCDKTMNKNGKPNEMPDLAYIVSLDNEGTKKLDNLRVCCHECASKSE